MLLFVPHRDYIIDTGDDATRIVKVSFGVEAPSAGHATQDIWVGTQQLIRANAYKRTCSADIGWLATLKTYGIDHCVHSISV